MRGQRIVFGQHPHQVSHTFRHTDAVGLERAIVIDAITRNLFPYLPLPVRATGGSLFVGRVTVDGIELHYHAYPRNQRIVNVGRITA